jgi:hypothetical protein
MGAIAAAARPQRLAYSGKIWALRRGWGENWGSRSATATYRQFGERERQQPTFPHLASFLVLARAAGGPPFGRGGLRRTGFEGASAPALAYSAKSQGRREGWRKLGGMSAVGCRYADNKLYTGIKAELPSPWE